MALAALPGCECLWAPCRSDWKGGEIAPELEAVCADRIKAASTFHLITGLLLELHGDASDPLWLLALQRLSAATGLPLIAAGDVHMHVRARKRLQDVMTAIRLGRPVQACGFELQPNGERHLRPLARLGDFYPPDTLAATQAVAARCHFRLEEVKYNYPQEAVLPGLSPTQTLARLVREGAAWRFPGGTLPHIQAFIDKELALIAECRYEMFFLTVHDIVRAARRMGILCQGRGSAANSVVCYCLGITEADPRISNPLLERFISRARRHEPPDIDVDFEHERREEVIQYIYRKYGRHRAALAATVISYRTRSALRDVGMALGVDARLIDAFSKGHHWFDDGLAEHRLGELAAQVGAAVNPTQARLWLELTRQLKGAPRHLSQHVGGFVLTETPLHRLVPVEPAAMTREGDWENTLGVLPDEVDASGDDVVPSHGDPGGHPRAGAAEAPPPAARPYEPSPLDAWLPAPPALRQVIQWDKDDLEALGMLKVDVLALGMLTAVRRCIDLVSQRRGHVFTRADIQGEDPATYEMIRRADTIGTFQIESRAQMSMLPRLKPTTFYDLVVQVAIVRPGPISGGMVHPYLKARDRQRRNLPIEYELSSDDQPGRPPRLAKALARTLGIPIFQEQVMELSMIAAGFSADDADRLRRAMAAWKRKGGLGPFEAQLTEGMLKNGYSPAFAARIFQQIKGFGEYGFPESHAYSFALIAYESAWLKCHEPEAFLAALLNSQPMGFYGPSQLIQDARRHGVQVLPPDVSASDWDCTLEAWAPAAQSGSESDFCGAESDADAALHRGAGGNEINADFKSNHLPAQQPLARPAPDAIANIACADTPTRPAVRLGLCLVKGLSQTAAQRIEAARAQQPFASVDDLARRAGLDTRDLNALAAADALASLAGHRRQQAWRAVSPHAPPLREVRCPDPGKGPRTSRVLGPSPPSGGRAAASRVPHTPSLLQDAPIHEPALILPPAPEGEDIVHDYAALGLTLRRHPLALLRPRLERWRLKTADQLRDLPHGRRVRACGLVIGRQQPGTAKGTIFVTLEDETGPVNVIVWKSVRDDEAQRNALLRARLLAVEGEWQRDKDSGGEVRHLIAQRFRDLTPLLGRLGEFTSSRDFH
ncbi:helix-hairpin-helix domain-containing protein [Ottowia flava]|uniref:helix-hairpin-helix domain-containing protein n=1 Tax=Ottowia flava TaxID=2675430 RepID=UPI003A9480A3